ncbi:hypothetical protein F0562_026423 [Nyssa sinensis]|uniref:HMG box domain-containing protein n=1 Tax=Nyssa sinensis TaxID=561372 RepID=A0A5J5BEZ5_9ASTE|nr:hypothetical protein F0562_026423 [Nyssa sinensis]
MAENGSIEIPPNPTSSTPVSSIPFQLSGFLSGDTIQVQGDTHNLQFSVQFNVHHKHNSENHYRIPANTPQNQTSLSSSSSSSSYMTPITTHEEDHQNGNRDISYHAIDWVPTMEECHATEKGTVVTRLRSGVLSPVTYFPQSAGVVRGNLSSWRKGTLRKKGKGNGDVLERVLRRRSFPARPCSSYAFFLMTTWSVANKSSFGETSKSLAEMWFKLPQKEKKVFEDMAMKDNARYKRQCMLLRSEDQDDDD